MDTKQFTRDNHYVPQAYLKSWSIKGNWVWSNRLLVPHVQVPLWKKSSPRGLAKHQNLYTRSIATGESDEMEHWLNAEFETPAQGAIERAIRGERLTPEDWRALIRFLAAQDARTPARMFEAMKRWERTLPGILNDVLEGAVKKLEEAKRTGMRIAAPNMPHAEYLPIRVTKTMEPGAAFGSLQLHTVAGRGMWLFSLQRLLTQTIEILYDHKWTIVQCPPGMQWITSDDPVIKLNARGPQGYDFGGGWGSKGTEIFMPLGPRHMLYTAVGHRPPPTGIVLSTNIARTFQRFQAEHAHRYIFASEENVDVALWRPRVVDLAAFKREAEQWNQWHLSQLNAERDLRS